LARPLNQTTAAPISNANAATANNNVQLTMFNLISTQQVEKNNAQLVQSSFRFADPLGQTFR